MAVVDTLLGGADGTSSLALALDVAVPGDGVLQLVFATLVSGGSAPDNTHASAVTDPTGNLWTRTTASLPIIGLQQADDGTHHLQVGSAARVCAAGDLSAGDTVSLTFFTGGSSIASTALLVFTPTSFVAIEPAGLSGIRYDGGDAYPSVSSSPTTLHWLTDMSSFYIPKPDLEAHMIVGLAAYPALAGFTPVTIAKLGERSSSTCSIVAGIAHAPAAVTIEPGGAWPSARSILVGNYQFDTDLPAPPAGDVHIAFPESRGGDPWFG